jgi:hypothetical protein
MSESLKTMNPVKRFEFVTFHVALSSDAHVHPNKTLKHREYLEMIEMMFSSARLFHKTITTTLLTDQQTNFGGMFSKNRIVRYDMDTGQLMFERAAAQLRHVESSLNSAPMVLLDSDILLNGSLADLFDLDFDVAVTWRESKVMPINGGLLVLNNRRPEVTKEFFRRFVNIYQEKYLDKAAWFGDQLALRDVIGIPLRDFHKERLITVQGCKVLLLHCDEFNFSPQNHLQEICTDLNDKVVLHFKGERKRLMPLFWKAWLRHRYSKLPWYHYIALRKRAWLNKNAILEPVQKQEKEG